MLTMICNVMCVDMKHVCLSGSGCEDKNPDLDREKMHSTVKIKTDAVASR